MRNRKILIFILLLFGIGFATVTTTLLMTGNVKIATNNDDYDVIFTKAVIDGVESPSSIINSGKSITFNSKDLVSVNDVSKLDFEVTNNSEMYDAEVHIDCTSSGDKSSYYQILSDGEMVIPGKRIGAGKVEVKLLKASAEDFSETFTCTLISTAKERTTRAYMPKYFEFGEPTTLSTQDYTTLKYPDTETQAKAFIGVDEKGQKSVCTLATGNLECFRNGNWEEEERHVTDLFSDITYSSDNSVLHCSIDDLYCDLNSDGYVNCGDSDANFRCSLSPSGRANCYY